MASVDIVKFTTDSSVAFSVDGLGQQSADAVSKVLQKNHDEHDFIYTDWGAHNHIAHHISTVFALGATPDEIEARYQENVPDQRPPPAEEKAITESLRDRNAFAKLIGSKTTLYSSFLVFFTNLIKANGWQTTCKEYIFAEDELSKTMLRRLCSAICHPAIHLGIGVEFKQPAIIAEALAQTACHRDWEDPLWIGAAEYVRERKPEKVPMIEIIYDIQRDEKIRNATQWKDSNKVRDGLLVRAKDEMIVHAAKWQVYADDDLDKATAEMINACAYFAGSAIRPNKQINFDFHYMHMVTSSIFSSVFLRQDWLSRESKAKFLTWQGRYNVCIYASRHCPKLHPDEIINYKPLHLLGDWQSLFQRARQYRDDGHAAKFVRSLANGEKQCRRYEGESAFPMKQDMWLLLANMVMDTVEVPGHQWIRSNGFDEAWTDVPDRM